MSDREIDRWRRRARPGFTLTELLVAVTILSMLAAMVWGALIVSRVAAREAATRATIAKLHNIIMAKYESYRTRRIPLSEEDMQWVAQNRLGWNPMTMPWDNRWRAAVRLCALRDLMRMEMPERWTDVKNTPIFFPPSHAGPSLYQAYRARCYGSGNPAPFLPTDDEYQAECLYMIVAMGCGADARRQFRAAEIGDTDNDGFPEFVDGWGRPIYFLRWAPGFNDSDLQWNIDPPLDPGQMSLAAQEDHDPLDTRRVDPAAWRLMPLVYSAGADGEFGLWMKFKNEGNPDPYYIWNNNTYVPAQDPADGKWYLMGQPIAGTHYDNIHNHRLEAR